MAQSFDVVFVGLFCFRIDDRKVVMPDARIPVDPNPPFTPFLVVDPKDIDTSSGWGGNDPARTAQGIYILDKCTIQITKATETGVLDPTQFNDNAAKLHNIDNSFAFDPGSTDIITTINLGRGTLTLRKRPDQDANAARLRVNHEGDIFVTVVVQGEAEARVLELRPGSSVAIVNLPLPPIGEAGTGDPSEEFGKIAVERTFDAPSGIKVPGMPAIGENYQVFKIKDLNLISIEPASCCPPP